MLGTNLLPRWFGKCVAAGAVALALSAGLPASEAPAAPAGAASPIPPGAARIWFYRNYEPYGSRNLTSVALNGTPVGYVQPEGTAFYRDVAPGRYHITVASEDRDVNQDSSVDLAPGQQAFVKVVELGNWETGGDKNVFTQDTFYARVMPPQLAQAEISGQH